MNKQNQHTLMKMNFYLTKLLNEFVTEYKCAVRIWKVVSKIILKIQLFVDVKADEGIFFMKHPNNDGSYEVKIRTVFYNFFLTLYENLYINLKTIRTSIESVAGNSDTCTSVMSMTSQSSQRGSNVTQEIIKRVRFTSFLFKIYKKFVDLYQSVWLNSNETFFMMTNIFSVMGFILLYESKVDTNDIVENGIKILIKLT